MANVQHSSLTGAELHVPKTHKDSHVDGNDDIRDATAALKGIATAAQITKLDGIEALATADQSDAEIKTAIENATHLKIASTLELYNYGIIVPEGDNDNSGIRLNYEGYNRGATRFRDLIISDGKQANIIFVDGSSKQTTFSGPIIIPTSTPASAGAAGAAGQIAWDASYMYVCTATDTWKRTAIATW